MPTIKCPTCGRAHYQRPGAVSALCTGCGTRWAGERVRVGHGPTKPKPRPTPPGPRRPKPRGDGAPGSADWTPPTRAREAPAKAAADGAETPPRRKKKWWEHEF